MDIVSYYIVQGHADTIVPQNEKCLLVIVNLEPHLSDYERLQVANTT